jgi:hypothetical protein
MLRPPATASMSSRRRRRCRIAYARNTVTARRAGQLIWDLTATGASSVRQRVAHHLFG